MGPERARANGGEAQIHVIGLDPGKQASRARAADSSWVGPDAWSNTRQPSAAAPRSTATRSKGAVNHPWDSALLERRGGRSGRSWLVEEGAEVATAGEVLLCRRRTEEKLTRQGGRGGGARSGKGGSQCRAC